jgi:hypothetical protein
VKYAVLLIALFCLAGCDNQGNFEVGPLTYQQLVDYPVSCDLADQQLAELKKVQDLKNFNEDPDHLTEVDRAYNSRLKATIWWYTYRCAQ